MYREMAFGSPLVVVASDKLAFPIEVSTGMTKWAYAMKLHPCRVVIANERVYVASDAELACVEYLTGKAIFHIHTDIAPDVTLLVDGEHIFLGASGKVACYDQLGQRLWKNDLGTGSGVGFALPGLAQQIDIKG